MEKRDEIIRNEAHGVFEYGGREFILLEDAYADYSAGNYPRYSAKAIAKGAEPDEDGEVKVYRLFWDVLPEYTDLNDDLHWGFKEDAPEEESDLCDWDEPSDLAEEGVMDADGWIH